MFLTKEFVIKSKGTTRSIMQSYKVDTAAMVHRLLHRVRSVSTSSEIFVLIQQSRLLLLTDNKNQKE